MMARWEGVDGETGEHRGFNRERTSEERASSVMQGYAGMPWTPDRRRDCEVAEALVGAREAAESASWCDCLGHAGPTDGPEAVQHRLTLGLRSNPFSLFSIYTPPLSSLPSPPSAFCSPSSASSSSHTANTYIPHIVVFRLTHPLGRGLLFSTGSLNQCDVLSPAIPRHRTQAPIPS